MQAIKDLREALGMSQNQFAVKIKKSYQSVQRYEQTKAPTGKELVPFLELARECKRYDLAIIFKQAAIDSVPEEVMRLIRTKGPEDDYTPGKEAAVQGARHKGRVRA